MASTLFICLVFAATITIGVQQNFCVENNLNDGPLAYQNCTLACSGADPAFTANAIAEDGTPCMYTSEGGNSIGGSSGTGGMQRGECNNNACILATNESPGSTMNLSTKKANTNASGAATSPAASHNASTMPSNNGSSQATSMAMSSAASHSSPPAGMTTPSVSSPTTINVSGKLTTSHNGTTVHANQTTTRKPSSAASPSRLLGSASQGAIIIALALAVLGRSP